MPKSLDRLDRRILDELQADARISNQELAKRVGLSPAPCWRRLQRLERDGLIAGEPDPSDRRSTLLRLTPLGLERAENAMRAAGATNVLALSALKPAERPLFIDMLKRIIATLEADG